MNPEDFKKLYDKKEEEKKTHLVHNFKLIVDQKSSFDVGLLAKNLESKLPYQITAGINEIIIGEFDFLQNSGKESVYKSGTIYVVNTKSFEETYSAIVHEIAHVLENYRIKELYSDGKLKSEFLKKRLYLYNLIEGYFPEINLDKNYYINIKYNKTFDDFIIHDIGYGKLETISSKLFISPYAATSLSEYFARNFEEYYSLSYERKKYLAEISPMVYSKIANL